MLVSASIRHDRLFAGVRAVVVDEVHAFARDDRGWHLLALLQRIGRLAGRDLQRIGLSATVGNEDDLLAWLSAGSDRPRRVIRPPAVPEPPPEVQLDYVGHLDNAATVIAALHRGEKRLVFCDSRARVEQLAAELRLRRVETFVSHSSLGLDERRQAERAFAQGRDCVIVATSALELGIDVGDLDRVIQIDAPGAVSSFLQRMGRTGRRPGMARNCLFLATSDEGLLRAAGLVDLWAAGFVEPAVPPPEPLHILAQQLLALALQERGIGRSEWLDWVRAVPAFRAAGPRRRRPDRRRDAREGDPLGRGGRALAGPRGPGRLRPQELPRPDLGLHGAAAVHRPARPPRAGLRRRVDVPGQTRGRAAGAAPGGPGLAGGPPRLEAAAGARRAGRGRGPLALAGRGPVPLARAVRGHPADPGRGRGLPALVGDGPSGAWRPSAPSSPG